MGKKMVPIALSNRHIHLSKEDVESLFGEGYELKKIKALSQPGQFACEEKVDLIGPKKNIRGVRVLGPTRAKTQIEISLADSFVLGIKPPVRDSGDIAGSPGVKIVGPKGEVELKEGVIVAARHIHMHPNHAKKFGVEDNQRVKVRTSGERSIIFENVLVRSKDSYDLEMHVDVEEGNAAALKNGDMVELVLD